MATWNALNGEARFFQSDNCANEDTYIKVMYDTYSDFSFFEFDERPICSVGTFVCWETGLLHWNSNTNWYVGTGTPPTGWYDAWSMFTHELGHALYLDHATAGSLATMQASIGGTGSIFMRTLKGQQQTYPDDDQTKPQRKERKTPDEVSHPRNLAQSPRPLP